MKQELCHFSFEIKKRNYLKLPYFYNCFKSVIKNFFKLAGEFYVFNK